MPLTNAEGRLQKHIAGFANDPLGFVEFAFPWGQGALADCAGPDAWQARVLADLAGGLREAGRDGAAVRLAVASGHGVGKTALAAWLVLWFLSTRSEPQAVVTANTANQLATKTWRELAKWHRLAINGHWFAWSALARLAGLLMAWLAGRRRARNAALERSNEVKDAQLDAANDRPRGRGDLARRLRDAGF
jgi:hypothetical protein